ncbi:hypothetical protein HYC85_009122 [Camellia sinensis]|uniref:Uncharacterized protein n=1 Tax=Camellia sinensis TaxID=4442 RepID=A0A7J7HGR6_CAMSI|nr:hypothetical protein HYC85_009122 [Camellia sinensis]
MGTQTTELEGILLHKRNGLSFSLIFTFPYQSALGSTPNPKVKQVVAKYLITSRNKNCLPSPNSFRSVQNLKPTSIAEPKNRTVAKAFVFQSPKKVISIKTSSELRTPLTKICEGMKRLEISSQRKHILGYSNKSSKDIKRNPDKSLPLDPSTRKLGAYEDKSKAKELFRPPNFKEKGNKSLRCIEKGNKPCNSMPKETVKNDLSRMEIDMKSRDSSVFGSSSITEGNVCEEWLSTEKTSGNLDTINSTREEAVTCLEVVPLTKNSDMVLLDASRGEMNTSSNSEEGSLEENDLPKFEENSERGNESNEGIDEEGKTKASSEKRKNPKDHKTEPENLGVKGHEGEAMDSDDKENVLASDGNRCEASSGRKIFRKQETNEITKKFLIRKLQQPQCSQAEVYTKKHGNEIQRNDKCLEQRNDKCLEQRKCNHDTNESSGNELQKNYKKDEPKQSRTVSERQAYPNITPQRCSKSTQQKPKPITSRLDLRKTKSSSQHEQFISPKGVASTKKAMACGKQLTVIKEISSTASRSKEAGDLSHSDISHANKAATSSASSSLSWGKRPLTIPKEPNFHNIRVPKCCTRKVA